METLFLIPEPYCPTVVCIPAENRTKSEKFVEGTGRGTFSVANFFEGLIQSIHSPRMLTFQLTKSPLSTCGPQQNLFPFYLRQSCCCWEGVILPSSFCLQPDCLCQTAVATFCIWDKKPLCHFAFETFLPRDISPLRHPAFTTFCLWREGETCEAILWTRGNLPLPCGCVLSPAVLGWHRSLESSQRVQAYQHPEVHSADKHGDNKKVYCWREAQEREQDLLDHK